MFGILQNLSSPEQESIPRDSTKSEGVRSTPRTGARGETFLEKRGSKVRKPFDWLQLQHLLDSEKQSWLLVTVGP